MLIRSGDGKQYLNSEFIQRYCIVKKPDTVLIVASYGTDKDPVTMAKYATMEEAIDAMDDLASKLEGPWYYFPESSLFHPERIVHDARAKRKGGS